MVFLSSKETAKKLGISSGTLANWRVISKGPKFINVGWAVLYTLSDIDKYLAEKKNEH